MREDRRLIRGEFADPRLPIVPYQSFCKEGDIADLGAPGDRIAVVSGPVSLTPPPCRTYGAVPPRTKWNRSFTVPPMYVAKVENAVVTTYQRLIGNDFGGWLPDSFRTYRGVSGYLERMDDGTYVLPGVMKVRAYLPGAYFYLDGVHAGHYGHFFVEVLSRLWAAPYLDLDRLRFLVWEKNWRPWMLDLLRPFGVTMDRVQLFRYAVQCESLIVARQGISLRNYVSPLVGDLWRALGSHYPGSGEQRRIYVSRSRIPGRRLINEEEVEEEVRKHGFSVFHPQCHSFEEQVRTLRGAEAIIQPVGSNTYGSLLVDHRPKILLLCPNEFLRSEDQMLNAVKRQDVSTLFGESVQPGVAPIRADWKVDLQCLTDTLADWL